MSSEHDHFERNMRKHLDAFLNPKPKPKLGTACPGPKGIKVHLAVRESRLSPDHLFVHQTNSISHLEARIEAERAAKKAGWPIIGYVVDYQ